MLKQETVQVRSLEKRSLGVGCVGHACRQHLEWQARGLFHEEVNAQGHETRRDGEATVAPEELQVRQAVPRTQISIGNDDEIILVRVGPCLAKHQLLLGVRLV